VRKPIEVASIRAPIKGRRPVVPPGMHPANITINLNGNIKRNAKRWVSREPELIHSNYVLWNAADIDSSLV